MDREKGQHTGDILLGYYGKGLSQNQLAQKLGLKYPATIMRLRVNGLEWLFEHLPEESEEFPINKYEVFDLGQLKATSSRAMSASGEKQARERHGDSGWGRRTAAIRWYGSDDSPSETDV